MEDNRDDVHSLKFMTAYMVEKQNMFTCLTAAFLGGGFLSTFSAVNVTVRRIHLLYGS